MDITASSIPSRFVARVASVILAVVAVAPLAPTAHAQTGGRPGGSYRGPGNGPPPGQPPYRPTDYGDDFTPGVLAPTTEEVRLGAPGPLEDEEMQPRGPVSVAPWHRGRRTKLHRREPWELTPRRLVQGTAIDPYEAWEAWWERHRRWLLDLRLDRQGSVEDRTVRFFLGSGHVSRGMRSRPPSRALVEALVVPALVHATREAPSPARDAALIALAEAGHGEEIVRVLLGHLDAPSRRTRDAAILGLGILGEPEAVAALLQIVTDDAAGRRRLGSEGPVPDTARSLAAVSIGLARIDSADASIEAALRSLLRGGSNSALLDPIIGGILGLTLAEAPGVSTELIALAQDESMHPFGRACAMMALGWIGERDAIPCALSWLRIAERTSPPVLLEATLAMLGRLGDPEDVDVIAALEAALRTSRIATVRHAAVMALGDIGGDPARSILLLQVRRGSNRDLRPWAALALGVDAWRHGAPHPRAAACLLSVLEREHDPSHRGALAIALGLLGHAEASAELLDVVRGAGDPSVRAHAALALGLSRDLASRDRLEKVVRDETEDSRVLLEAATALGWIDRERGVTTIVDALRSASSVRARSSLAIALGRLGGVEAVEPLVDRLRAENATVEERAVVATALGRLCTAGRAAWHERVPPDLPVHLPVETLRALEAVLP